jgi:hypothetical protein
VKVLAPPCPGVTQHTGIAHPGVTELHIAQTYEALVLRISPLPGPMIFSPDPVSLLNAVSAVSRAGDCSVAPSMLRAASRVWRVPVR